ncbi:MAG: acyl-CoA thioesterase [Microbacteriaceae bacterium]|nr:MAG: acyl-CoA thioesterase [Microbacteriaceae bacterium]
MIRADAFSTRSPRAEDAGQPGGDRITLRFLASTTDVTANGQSVPAGRVLEWIDNAGYACAVGWAGTHCVTAYVGNIHFTRPIRPGDLVEVHAQIMLTGTSSMHILVTVRASDIRTRQYQPALHCIVIFVAVDGDGTPCRVPTWHPATVPDLELQQLAEERIELRQRIQAVMQAAHYSGEATSPSILLRFLATPADVDSSGKVHGGTVMRWIDEAAYACAAGWSSESAAAVYAGGIQFRHPIAAGNIVEVHARLIHTGPHSMHINIHVQSAPVHTPNNLTPTAQCLSIFVQLDSDGHATTIDPWVPASDADKKLDTHALTLIELRNELPAIPPETEARNHRGRGYEDVRP